MSVITISGEKLNFQVHYGGPQPSDPPLVLVHGAGGSLMHWPGALRRLTGHTVYALDLPGHGRSGGHGRTEIGAYAEIVRVFADTLGLPAFVLAGHSMGGGIALEFALRYPTRLAGMILVATGARLRVAPQILAGILNDFDATVELLAVWAHGDHVDPNTLRLYTLRLREIDPQVTHHDYLACDAFDRAADVRQITLPSLIVCGDADRMTPLKFSQYLHAEIAGSQLLVLPGTGHMAMLEQPAIVGGAVTRFLTSLASAALAGPRPLPAPHGRGG